MLTELIHQNSCKKTTLITDLTTGEIACGSCGTVFAEKSIEFGPENSVITGEEYMANSRVGRKISLKMVDMGLSTIIESQDKDSTGKSLSRENSRIFHRLRMWDRNSRSANTIKSFHIAFILLDGIRTKLGLPEPVVEYTAYLFRKISAKKIIAGRSTTGILCATAYIACRLTNTPRTLQDIANAGNVKKKALQKLYRFIVNELNIYPAAYSPDEFVARIAKAINVSEKTQRWAFRILAVVESKEISTSKNPMAIAAAAVHLAVIKNHEKVSQAKLSKISGISTVTIRNRAKEIKKLLGDKV
jgi:transcription initiation factor TFIIB